MIKKAVTVTCDACKTETIQKEGDPAVNFGLWCNVAITFRDFEKNVVLYLDALDLCALCSDLPYTSLCRLMTDNLSRHTYEHRQETARVTPAPPAEEAKGII